jgi:hypothetical protein
MTDSAKITIDPEIAGLCPRLKDHEAAQLEENLQHDGCRDPLVLWSDTLLDGHNRYEICQRLGLEFATVQAHGIEDRAGAIDWVIKNQLGRRNLTLQERDYLIGKRYTAEKMTHAEAGAQGGRGKAKVGLTPALAAGESEEGHAAQQTTAAQIASEVGVSEKTVKRAEPFAQAIDVLIATCGEDVGREIREGKSKLSREKVIELAQLPRRSQAKAYRAAKLAASKPRRPVREPGKSQPSAPAAPPPPVNRQGYVMPTAKGEKPGPDLIEEVLKLWSQWDQRHVERYCVLLKADDSEEAQRTKKRCAEVIGHVLSRLTMLANACKAPRVTTVADGSEVATSWEDASVEQRRAEGLHG